jgi:hypothetical protein
VLYQLSYASPNSAHTPVNLTNVCIDSITGLGSGKLRNTPLNSHTLGHSQSRYFTICGFSGVTAPQSVLMNVDVDAESIVMAPFMLICMFECAASGPSKNVST